MRRTVVIAAGFGLAAGGGADAQMIHKSGKRHDAKGEMAAKELCRA